MRFEPLLGQIIELHAESLQDREWEAPPAARRLKAFELQRVQELLAQARDSSLPGVDHSAGRIAALEGRLKRLLGSGGTGVPPVIVKPAQVQPAAATTIRGRSPT